jgi:hypothetical protein
MASMPRSTFLCSFPKCSATSRLFTTNRSREGDRDGAPPGLPVLFSVRSCASMWAMPPVSSPYPVPPVFWHPYDHPERRPDPDRATALAATVAAFPSWYFHSVCGGCGRRAYVSQTGLLLEGWGERRVCEVVASLRCKGCGQRPAVAELVNRLDAHGDGPIRRVRLAG